MSGAADVRYLIAQLSGIVLPKCIPVFRVYQSQIESSSFRRVRSWKVLWLYPVLVSRAATQHRFNTILLLMSTLIIKLLVGSLPFWGWTQFEYEKTSSVCGWVGWVSPRHENKRNKGRRTGEDLDGIYNNCVCGPSITYSGIISTFHLLPSTPSIHLGEDSLLGWMGL